MMKKLGVCVIGCGRIANQHLTAISHLESVDLVAVVDRDKERAENACKKYGTKRYYCETEEAFKDSEIDAVVLCLPHYLHSSVAIKAAQYGKHMLVEKPLANTTEEADRMIRAAERNGVTLMVGQSRRFFRAVMESKRRIEEIGKLFHINTIWTRFVGKPSVSWWKSADKAGGLLIALNGSHAIDYILWIFGKAPRRVYAETLSINPAWEGEDEVSMVMGFDEGAIATVQLSFNDRLFLHTGLDHHERHIIGSKGTMHLIGETELIINGKQVVHEKIEPEIFTSQLEAQMREFVEAIREKREPAIPVTQSRQVVQVLEAARRSASCHQVIML